MIVFGSCLLIAPFPVAASNITQPPIKFSEPPSVHALSGQSITLEAPQSLLLIQPWATLLSDNLCSPLLTGTKTQKPAIIQQCLVPSKGVFELIPGRGVALCLAAVYAFRPPCLLQSILQAGYRLRVELVACFKGFSS